MDNEAMKEVLNELFSHLERLETQNEAILQFLKEKKRVTDKQLAPYLEQAGNASSVKWRAARVRIDHLLEPEHPEEEIKLGKKPELHDGPSTASSTDSSQSNRSETADQKDKRSESGNQKSKRAELGDLLSGDRDQRNKEKSEEDDVKAHPAEVKTEKPEVKSEASTASKQVAAQARGRETSDAQDALHSMEVTEPLAEQQSAEPGAQLNSKDNDQEAA
jgi:hypothetical protein